MQFKSGEIVLALIGAALAIGYTGVLFGPGTTSSDWAQAGLSWGFVVALAMWRSRPAWAAGLMVGLNVIWSLIWLVAPTNIGYTLWILVVPFGVFTVRRYASRPFGLAVALIAAAWSFISPFMWTWDERLVLYYRTPIDAAVVLALHWAGIAVAYLFASNMVAEERSRQREASLKEERLLLAREEERRDIARDIHDVLGHTLTLIKVQANAGLAGEQERQALETIRTVAGEALTDIRTLVHDLREDDAGLEPAATIQQIPTLVERFRAAGVDVSLDLTEPEAVTSVVSVAANRIVAEAVTNAAKHQVDPVVNVTVAPAGTGVDVTVISTGRWDPHPGAGTGIVGMRERARSAGGTLGVTADGDTVTVHARLDG